MKRRKKQKRFNVLLAIAVVATMVSCGLLAAVPNLAATMRDVFFAMYAHNAAGGPTPFNPAYVRGLVLNPIYAWGATTNSQWLLDKMSIVVPYFAAEKVTGDPVYAPTVLFVPYQGQRSFVVAGSAQCAEGEQPFVILNERVLLDGRWNDEADALHTLVHELIHVQGGNFCSGTSEQLESKTEAASIEVLAAMCNWGEELACKGFWGGIEGFARRAVWVQAHSSHMDWLYNVWSDLFMRSDAETRAAHKTDRFWADSSAERYAISYKYGYLPWRDIVLAGVWSPRQGLNTGQFVRDERGRHVTVLIMPFDDTRDLLGWLAWFAGIR